MIWISSQVRKGAQAPAECLKSHAPVNEAATRPVSTIRVSGWVLEPSCNFGSHGNPFADANGSDPSGCGYIFCIATLMQPSGGPPERNLRPLISFEGRVDQLE